MERFNVVPRPHERAIIHATAGLSLLDLTDDIIMIIIIITHAILHTAGLSLLFRLNQ